MSKPKKEQMRYLNVNRYLLNKQSIISEDPKLLEKKAKAILEQKISGISFSPYLEGQDPSVKSLISEQQIADRLEIIRPYTHWVRTFSTTNGNEEVPRIAKEKGLKTLVGAWLDSDKENNEIEINNIIRIGQAGYADLIAIGNEVLLRDDLEVEQLIEYIRRVKAAVPNVPVGYVDAYYMYVNFPEIVDECDVLFANCYPFWEYCALEISVEYMKKMYELVKTHSKGKPVVISETGWPTKGESYGAAVPSYENAMRYFINTYEWANQEHVHLFYFSSFDEVWKINHEGEYGAYWGLWDKDGKFKFEK
ncbi:glycoside hydrolase family 17 protein [Paracholeplasma manati]|uniref:glycoside hydrolase family 17 protein n=1 Tax=Paracholeplasma manati TaxID=591373 RepID=UPI002407A4B0|nr:glycosyl hydrolase family 17 protein [Paracholeplasma manati]MDG0888404.1 glycosyl hydrolase family 17 protein [Paracholeplasma manati]